MARAANPFSDAPGDGLFYICLYEKKGSRPATVYTCELRTVPITAEGKEKARNEDPPYNYQQSKAPIEG